MAHRTDKTRTEDLSTDQRAARHPRKSSEYTEEAQNVRDDDLGANVKPMGNSDANHARNKANESKGVENSRND